MGDTTAEPQREAGDGEPIVDRLKAFAVEFDRRFQGFLEPTGDVPAELLDAMRYSALAPGKRIRPYLVARCCEQVGGRMEDAWPVAAAVECMHAFSLIHDDLPAMDDDDLRRGLPTCHKRFGEAIAILAGDALSVLAFGLIGRHVRDGVVASAMIVELANGVGWSGMIGGQAADIGSQGTQPALEAARYIHERKTAALFESSCRLGAISGGGTNDQVGSLGRFGQRLGHAFQITDDLLDVSATAETLGKDVGKDARIGKQAFPQCVGIKTSRAMAEQAVNAAIAELEPFGRAAQELRLLAQYVVDRNY